MKKYINIINNKPLVCTWIFCKMRKRYFFIKFTKNKLWKIECFCLKIENCTPKISYIPIFIQFRQKLRELLDRERFPYFTRKQHLNQHLKQHLKLALILSSAKFPPPSPIFFFIAGCNFLPPLEYSAFLRKQKKYWKLKW